MSKVIIVGGNAAGMSAASQIKRQQPEWETIVLEKGEFISYAGCGMPYYIAGTVPRLEDLLELSPEKAIQERNIDLRLNHEVLTINPQEKELLVKSTAGKTIESFDYLLLATGTLPITEGLNLTDSEKIFSLKNLYDMQKIDAFIENNKPQKCAVIGGGYIAVEMLEAFKERGLETHLIHRRKDLAKTFDQKISDLLKNKMQEKGIVLNLNSSVKKVEERTTGVVVITETDELAYDFVLVATGVKPNTGFLENSSIEMGIKGSVKVNRYLQTNFDYIYAAGDCAETTNLITGKPAYVPLAPKANKEGFIAGLNICGNREKFPGIVGTAITKFFDLGVARTGLTLEEAQKNGFDPVRYDFSSGTKARYYPGTEELHSVLIINKGDGRILGSHLAGPLESVKTIDTYAALVSGGVTVREAFTMDLSYAPPFWPVFHPVVLAGRLGRKFVSN